MTVSPKKTRFIFDRGNQFLGVQPSFPTHFNQFETSEGSDLGSGAEPQGQISDSSVSLTGGARGTGARWEREGRTGQKREGEREKRDRERGRERESIYCIMGGFRSGRAGSAEERQYRGSRMWIESLRRTYWGIKMTCLAAVSSWSNKTVGTDWLES